MCGAWTAEWRLGGFEGREGSSSSGGSGSRVVLGVVVVV